MSRCRRPHFLDHAFIAHKAVAVIDVETLALVESANVMNADIDL